jgi:hypothetical protein
VLLDSSGDVSAIAALDSMQGSTQTTGGCSGQSVHKATAIAQDMAATLLISNAIASIKIFFNRFCCRK